MDHKNLYIDIHLDAESKIEFYDYALEEISKIESHILSMHGKSSTEINQLKMDIHSLKGATGSYGYLYITTACHNIEDLLQSFEGEAYDKEFSNTLLDKIDTIKDYINLFQEAKSDKDVEQALKKFSDNISKDYQQTSDDKLKVLVCDAKKLTESLIRGSHLPEKAHFSFTKSGKEVLSRVLSEKWDYLILSNQLNDIEGISILYALKSSSKYMPKILFTTSDDQIEFINDLAPDQLIKVDANYLLSVEEQLK